MRPSRQVITQRDLAVEAAEEALAAANVAAKTTTKLVAPKVPKDLPRAKMMPWYQVRPIVKKSCA